MAGISAIARKEISDAMSNRTFLLSLGVLILSMALTGATNNYPSIFKPLEASGDNPITWSLMIVDDLVPHINLLGALVAVAYGFNAINKERIDGNLKVLLSYPIYRDQVILGKLIAGTAVVSLATITSILIAVTLHLYANNVGFKPDLVLRFTIFTALSVLLLCGYLGLSMFFSIALKDQKIALLVMFLLIGLFNSQVFWASGRIISDLVYGPELQITASNYLLTKNPDAQTLESLIAYLSPAWSYKVMSGSLSFNFISVVVEGDEVLIPFNVWALMMNFLNFIVVLVIIPILTFAASYVLFTRRDIT